MPMSISQPRATELKQLHRITMSSMCLLAGTGSARYHNIPTQLTSLSPGCEAIATASHQLPSPGQREVYQLLGQQRRDVASGAQR